MEDFFLDGGQRLLRDGRLIVRLVQALLRTHHSWLVPLDAVVLGLNAGLSMPKKLVEQFRAGEGGIGFPEH